MPEAYFDHAAATPLLPEALAAMEPFLTTHFGNPQSIHGRGVQPQQAVQAAREQVAALINAKPDAIVFTASASESNSYALKGIARARQNKGRHVIVSAIEHTSVLTPARTLAGEGFELTELPVDRHGLVDPETLERAIRPDTTMVSIQHANNEIGTLQPLAALAAVCRERRVPFHSDGTAAIGRIPVDVAALKVDAYSFPAQSVYGPKGVAALYLRTGLRPAPLVEGGIQERGRRAGTENVPGIVGFGAAADAARRNLPEWAQTMGRLSRRIMEELPKKLEHVVLTGHLDQRVPGHASLCIEFIEGEAMLLFLADSGIAAASGSACTAKNLKASHVLLALGISHGVAQSSLMLTLGKDNTDADVDLLLRELPPITERLRQMSPLYARFLKGEDPYESNDKSDHGGH